MLYYLLIIAAHFFVCHLSDAPGLYLPRDGPSSAGNKNGPMKGPFCNLLKIVSLEDKKESNRGGMFSRE